MASASSSSGSVPNAPRKYDVFISFRGEDTRNNFTGHLYAALKRAYLDVFRDDKKLKKGDKIKRSLIKAIKDSSAFVVVFSKDYASSKWCLDELDQIMQYRKKEGQFVIPIFYKVNPKDVRNQTGDYEEAFKQHEKNHPDSVERWRDALSKAGKLSGKHYQTSMDESDLIEEIVADVCTKLELIHNCHVTLKDVIGIGEMVKPIRKLLKKSHKVGIWGMGGVGKTTMAKVTMAKVVLNTFPSPYKPCFLENVREETGNKGLKHVRDTLVSKLLGENKQIDSSNEPSVFRRLGRIKAFVVLDDVDTAEQVEDLQDNICNFLGEGSKVIITTRDQKLLKGKGYEIHEVKGLSSKNSRRLFICNAFGSDNAKDGYEELIEGFVDYTKHNPLALKVLGSLVCSERKKLWRDLLRKLREGNPNERIQKVLRLSYDSLDRKEKKIFLDIACFLKGESEEFVEELMESCGFYPIVGMQTLKDKALIYTTGGKAEMHDLIQEMGRQIVCQESDEPGKRSRLWDSSKIFDVLGKCEGGKKVESIMLSDEYEIIPLDLTATTFNKMTRLRFLKILIPYYYCGMSTTPIGLESISTRISYFHWEGCPMKSLPSNFCAKHLLELNLSGGKVETIWEGVQDLPNLRRLNLRYCKNLRELPDFSKACRLESVDLRGCESLCYVHESLLSLHSLISLDVSWCKCLNSTAATILESISTTRIKYFCWEGYPMKLLPSNFCTEHLLELNLRNGEVETLWEGAQDFPNLRRLNLSSCSNLRELPDFSKACRLESINLYGCGNLCYVHLSPCLQRLNDLSLGFCYKIKEFSVSSKELTFLDLSFKEIEELSPSIVHCSKLEYLSVYHCTALHSLPELPPSLRTLKASYCTSLETVSPSTISSTPQNYGEKFFSFINCVKLDLGAIEEQVKKLLEKAVHEKEDVQVSFPGKKVPEWFGNNWSQNDSHTLKLCLSSSHTLVGFVFCAVSPDFLQHHTYESLDITFSVEEDEMSEEVVEFPEFTHSRSGNVLLYSYPKTSESILEKIEGNRRNHDATTNNPNLSFKFSFYSSLIEECGVYPIYASGNSKLNSNSRKRKAVMI